MLFRNGPGHSVAVCYRLMELEKAAGSPTCAPWRVDYIVIYVKGNRKKTQQYKYIYYL